MKAFFHSILTAALLFAVPAAVADELPDSVRQRPVYPIEEVVVTGTRNETDVRLLPMTVSVVDRAAIERSGRQSLLPILTEQVPGLFATARGIMGYGVSTGAAGGMSLRGIGGAPQAGLPTTGLLVLIDGHPQYMGLMGHPIADAYQSMLAERVEVVRGPASVLYGSNAMGGVINIVTRKQREEGIRTDLQAAYGSYNTLQTELSNRIRKGRFTSVVTGSYNRTDGHRADMGFEQYGGYAKLGYELSRAWTLSGDVNLTHFNASNPGEVTAPLIDNDSRITRGRASAALANRYDRTVCENRQLRNGNAVENIITYYAYDDCGRLAWVVTPKGSDLLFAGSSFSPESDFAKQNCYVYFYDEWGRVYEKRFPGREPMYVVYNRGDRPMMIQDGLMREKNRWLTFHYDGMGRVTAQKLVTDSAQTPQTREALQMSFDTNSYPQLYSSPASQILTQHVYDRYPTTMPAALAFEEIPDMTCDLTGIEPETLLDTSTTGLPTYEKLAAITDSSIGGEYHRAFYYDYKGREIQRVECDFEGNILRTTSRYDLIGNLLAQRESYTHGGTTDVLDRTFEYDSRNRMTKETAQFNDGEQAVVAYTYDELGQLSGKTYGTGAHAIHETMDYNMQGWLTEKSSELFEMKLRYYDPEPYYGGDAYYTGNISEWWWQHKNVNGNYDADNNTYIFHYDDLSRLNDSRLTYNESEDITDEFVENGITYDKNSNIITLNRSSLSSDDMKNYRFSYSGSQRIKDETSNSDYEYDANGNIHKDALTGFYIYYNLLNLPTVIYTEGDMGLYYTYLSDGTKIKVCGYDDNEPTRYAGSLVYNDGTFESASFGGGRIVGTNNGANSEVHYFLTDHLGSTRVVAKVTPTGREDLDRKDYYPFGKEWAQPDMPTSDNRYTFSGKEKQHLRFQEVDYADFGARFYDSDGVHFLQQDPKIENYVSITPYNYCFGNPIIFADHDGRDAKVAIDHNSRTVTVTANIFLLAGRGVGTDVAQYMQSSIVNAWDKGWTYTTEDGTQYAVKFNVKVRIKGFKETIDYNGINNYIDVVDEKITSETKNAKKGIWAKDTPDNNSAAHEFGHILGLDDKYNRDSNEHEPLPGWETNIMAGSRDENRKPRQVEQRNIDMFLENAMNSGATVYYINIYNSETYKNEKALKDKGKERPDIPIDGKWDR